MQRLHYAEWGTTEWLSAAGAIVSGRIHIGPHGDILRRELGDVFGERDCYLVNAGRTAIRLALDAFRDTAPTRDRVIVPGYICPSVIETVEACGLVPVGVDVGTDLNPTPESVARGLDERTLAVIAPHMYACPARIDEIERLCRSAGVFLIDDAAQVIGEELGGRVLGTFGDVGIISFAQSKALVTGNRASGGVLIVNSPHVRDSLRSACVRLPQAASCVGPFFHFVWNYLLEQYTGRSGYYVERLAGRLWPQRATRDYYRPATMSNLWAAIASRQFQRRASLRAGRIRAAALFHLETAAIPEIAFPQFASGRYLSRIVLLMPERVHMPSLRADLAASGVQTRRAYPFPVAFTQSAPSALAYARRLLEVPSHSEMSAADVRSVCQAIGIGLTRNAAAFTGAASADTGMSQTRA